MREKLGKWLRRPELVFLTLASIFGLLAAVFMPFTQVPDENRHFEIEYAMFAPINISNGTAFSRTVVISNDGPLAAVRSDRYWDYYTTRIPDKYDDVGITTSGYVSQSDVKVSVFDFMHLPQAIGVLLGRLIYPSAGVAALTGRLFNLIIYVAALFFIIKYIRAGKWILVFIACLPMMIQQAASLSYDGLNLIAIFAWFAFVINMFVQKTRLTRRQFLIGIAAAVLLLLTKANNILLLLLALGLPARYITDSVSYKKLRSGSWWRVLKAMGILFSVLLFFVACFVLYKKLLVGQPFHPHRLLNVLVNTFFLGDKNDLTLIDTTVNGMIGVFGIFYYHLPIWMVVAAFITLAIIMLHEKLPGASKRLAIISGTLFFVSVLVITVGMYYGWAMLPWRLGPGAQVADGIQGRYFTPLLVLLFPCIAYSQKRIKIVTTNLNTIPLITVGTLSFLLLFSSFQTWHFFWH